jgi:hypothetical protein
VCERECECVLCGGSVIECVLCKCVLCECVCVVCVSV